MEKEQAEKAKEQAKKEALEALEAAKALAKKYGKLPEDKALDEKVQKYLDNANEITQKNTLEEIHKAKDDIIKALNEFMKSNEKPSQEQKDALDKAIEDAEKVVEDENLSAEDKKDLEEKLDQAKEVQENPNASAKDVEDATNDLNDKVKEIEDKQEEANKPSQEQKEALDKAIEDAEEALKDKNLSAEDKKDLEEKLAKAKEVQEAPNASAKDVEDTTNDLNDKVKEIEDKQEEANKPSQEQKEALDKAIEDAEETLKDENLSAEDKKDLEEKLEKAKDVQENPDATAKDVEDATNDLNDKMKEIEGEKVATPEDKADLDALIKQVENILLDKKGNVKPEYFPTEEQEAALKDAYEKAKEVSNNKEATKNDVEDAYNQLEEIAEEVHDTKPTEADLLERDKVVKEAEDFLKDVEENDLPLAEEVKDKLQQAIEDAKKDQSAGKMEEAVEKLAKELEQAQDSVEGELLILEAKEAVQKTQEKVDAVKNAKEENKAKAITEAITQTADAKSKIAAILDKDQEVRENLDKQLGGIVLPLIEESVKQAEKTLTRQDLDQAKLYVSYIHNDVEGKEGLIERLDTVEQIVQTIETANRLIAKAEKEPTDNNIKAAENAINQVEKYKNVDKDLIASMESKVENIKVQKAKEELQLVIQEADQLEDLPTALSDDEVYEGQPYVLDSEKEEKNAALQNAQNKLKTAKTSEEVLQAKDRLENAMEPYQNPKLGTKNIKGDALEKIQNATDNRKESNAESLIKEAEDVIELIQDEEEKKELLDQLQQGAKNYVDAKKAVEKAEETGRISDIEQAKDAVGKLTVEDQKDFTEKLDALEVKHSSLEDLEKAIAEAEQKDAKNYTADSFKPLEEALEEAKKVKESLSGKEDESLTSEEQEKLTKATQDLEIAMEDLVESASVQVADIKKYAPMNLVPKVITSEEELKVAMGTYTDKDGKEHSVYEKATNNTAGGVLGLNIGILDLGLLSSEQISKISPTDRHTIHVAPGTELEATATVAIRGLLGGHAVKTHVFKKNDAGDYVKVATHRGSSGGALGMANTARMDLGVLEEGDYEIVLEVGGGLTVVQVIPYRLDNITIYDYNQVAAEAEIQGEIFKEEQSSKGGNDAGIITKVQGGPTSESQPDGRVVKVTGEKDKEGNLEETELQGKYGKLYMTQDGKYGYQPSGKRQNVGKYEDFKVFAKNPMNGTEDQGTLRVYLDSVTIEWISDTEAKIVEAYDQEKQTQLEMSPVTSSFTVKDKSERVKNYKPVISNEFFVADTDTVVDFELSKKDKDAQEVTVEFYNKDTKKVEHAFNAFIDNKYKKFEVTELPKGMYEIRTKAVRSDNIRIYYKDVTITSTEWGLYQGEVQEASFEGSFKAEPNFLGKNHAVTDTDLYVKGYSVLTDDENKIQKYEVDQYGNLKLNSKGEPIVQNKNSQENYVAYIADSNYKTYQKLRDDKLVVAGDYGFLEVDKDGNYKYTLMNKIDGVGQTEVFEYRLVHPSSKSADATLEIKIAPYGEKNAEGIIEGTDENDLITSTPEADTFKTGKGSDTIIYNVLDAASNDGGNSHDTWVDFTFGSVATTVDADRLDLRALFGTHEINELNVASYMKVQNNEDGSATLYIDRDGVSKDFEMTELITLKGDFQGDQKVTLKDLIANNQIIFN